MEFMETFEELRPGIVGVSRGAVEGTGFVIGVTLGGRATFVTSAAFGEWNDIVVVDSHGETYAPTLIDVNPQLDMAIFRICCSSELAALHLAEDDPAEAGDFVFPIVYAPRSSAATFSSGEVVTNWQEMESGRGIIAFDAPIDTGNMGGPLIKTSGSVAGIVTVGDVFSASGEPANGGSFSIDLATLRTALPASQELTGSFGEKEPSPTADSASSSVSGKPVDEDAEYGLVLQVAYAYQVSRSFSTWEGGNGRGGVGTQAMQPLHNMLIQTRTWGDLDDFREAAYFELGPDLADGWQVSTDGLEYAFNLRDSLEWSDGTAITCNDVKWSFDTIRTGEGLDQSPRAINFRNVEAITCADDLTVVFVLNDHDPTILESIALPQNIIRPAHVYEENFLSALRDEIPSVTSGPFEGSEWIPDESYRFERNVDYWDEPFPYLDGVELHLMDDDAIATAMRTGRIHIGSAVGMAGSAAGSLLQECANDVCQFWDKVTGSSFGSAVFINREREPFDDPRVGEAVALAVDNQFYIDSVRRGWGVLPTGCGFYPTSSWAMPTNRCRRIPGYGDVLGSSTVKEDKEDAVRLLANSDYDETRVRLELSVWSEIQEDILSLSQDLELVGFNLLFHVLETRAAQRLWEGGNFDIGINRFEIAGLDPNLFMYELFHSNGSSNYGGYSNTDVDEFIDRMSTTLDVEERRELAWDAMETALREQAVIIVAHEVYQPITSTAVRGFMPGPDVLARYGPQNRYDHVWLEESN